MTETIPVVEHAVWRVLLYFEAFSYPLTAEEVFAYCHCPGKSSSDVTRTLDALAASGQIFRFGNFFQTQNDPHWAARRHDNNRRAETFLPLAARMSRLIAAFPYVRGVFVSGSLSKHSMSVDSDIDFFVVTAPGRLWLARTLLVLFKKIVLFNSHKYFCVNYFVDTHHLEIEEKNLFSATEIVTLLPMYGSEWFERFCTANAWAWADFYPNCPPRPTGSTPRHRRSFAKKAQEWCLRGGAGDWLDRLAMRLTVGYWRRKFRHFEARDFEVALKSRRYVSKHHPSYFQKKVLERLSRRLEEKRRERLQMLARR